MSVETETSDAVRGMAIAAFIIPSAVAFLILCGCLFLWTSGKPVPDLLATLLTACVGYIFGALPGIAKDYIAAKKT